jgi:transposase InsO family protein
VHDDLVARQFTADGPDRTWLTDITEHPTAEGKLYLCAFKDVYSNRIVGYSMDSRMTAGLAVSALRNAIALREPAGTLVAHSDRGSQGEFNWSSHHLDHGGVRWDGGSRRRPVLGGSGRRIGRCGRRCGHRAALSRLVRCSGSSGG